MINQDHHTEQMEALRVGFLVLWTNDLRVRAISLGLNSPRLLFAAEDIAWQAFKYHDSQAEKPDVPCP